MFFPHVKKQQRIQKSQFLAPKTKIQCVSSELVHSYDIVSIGYPTKSAVKIVARCNTHLMISSFSIGLAGNYRCDHAEKIFPDGTLEILEEINPVHSIIVLDSNRADKWIAVELRVDLTDGQAKFGFHGYDECDYFTPIVVGGQLRGNRKNFEIEYISSDYSGVVLRRTDEGHEGETIFVDGSDASFWKNYFADSLRIAVVDRKLEKAKTEQIMSNAVNPVVGVV